MKLTKKMLSLIIEKANNNSLTDVLFDLIDDNYEVNNQALTDKLLGDVSEFKTYKDFDLDVFINSAKDWMYNPSTLDTGSIKIERINNIRNYIVLSYIDSRYEDTPQTVKINFSSYDWYKREYAKHLATSNAADSDAK